MSSDYSHPIEQIMETAMSKLKTIIDVNTVVGTAVKTSDNTIIIPVSKVTVGFVAGGGEYNQNSIGKKTPQDYPFAGGSGAGFNIVPVGFLIKEENSYKMVDIETDGTTASLIELVAKVFAGLNSASKAKDEVDDEK